MHIKLFEFTVIQANITKSKNQIADNLLWKYLSEEKIITKKFNKIKSYIDGIVNTDLNETELGILQILVWKALPGKAEFAQNLSLFLLRNIATARTHFNVPEYIKGAITHLTTYKPV